jgi:hypothetical protein
MKEIKPLITSLFLALMVLFIHLFGFIDSMLKKGNLHIDTRYLTSAIDYHKIQPAFAKRPLSTFLIEKLSLITNCQLGSSFVFVNFFFLFLSGYLLYKLSMQIVSNSQFSYLNMLAFFLCFSNVFAFFTPVYTYDEPLQFAFLFLSFIFLRKKKWTLYLLAFSISLIARESAILLIPGLLYLYVSKEEKFCLKNYFSKEGLYKSLLIVTPVFIYFIYLYIFITHTDIVASSKSDFTSRFEHFYDNFKNKNRSIESIFSFFLIYLIPLYLLFVLYIKKIKIAHKKYLIAFFITLIINTIIVYSTTKAREVRLFVIPLFFLWPIFSNLFLSEIKILFDTKIYKIHFKNWKFIVSFLIIFVINYLISYKIYWFSFVSQKSNYFNEYLFISILLTSTHALILLFSNNNLSST